MSNTTLPPEVEDALREIASRYDCDTTEQTAVMNDLREAYRLGLAAGREDSERLDELLRHRPDIYGRQLCNWFYDNPRDVIDRLRRKHAALRGAAKEADRG